LVFIRLEDFISDQYRKDNHILSKWNWLSGKIDNEEFNSNEQRDGGEALKTAPQNPDLFPRTIFSLQKHNGIAHKDGSARHMDRCKSCFKNNTRHQSLQLREMADIVVMPPLPYRYTIHIYDPLTRIG